MTALANVPATLDKLRARFRPFPEAKKGDHPQCAFCLFKLGKKDYFVTWLVCAVCQYAYHEECLGVKVLNTRSKSNAGAGFASIAADLQKPDILVLYAVILLMLQSRRFLSVVV